MYDEENISPSASRLIDGRMPKKGDTSTNVTVLSRHPTRHEKKRLLPSSCLSVHQHVAARSGWTDFREL